MKAIIFDLDNTLIPWKDEFISALKNVLKNMHYDLRDEKVNMIDKAIETYQDHYSYLTKENILKYINDSCNTNFPLIFIDNLIEEQKKCIELNPSVNETLDYLSQKYDLYVISNWFTETQKGRLANMGILKYFKEVYGSDVNYIKPHPKTFQVILDKYPKDACISIGDSLKNDVKLPLSLGMQAIWKTKKNIKGYKKISEIKDLRKIL